MKITLSLILTSILLILSFIHFYWAIGGKWGLTKALPTNAQGVLVLQPGPMASIMVGIALLAGAIFYLIVSDILKIDLPSWVLNIAIWLIPIVFTMRAIGDFKYVGFFKKITMTEFANLDTSFYSPLCLVIGIMGFVIARIN